MTNPAAKLTEDAILAVLRDATGPLDVARIRKAVADRFGLLPGRSTVDRALNRLRLTGVTAYVDNPDHPARRWLAAPADITTGIGDS